MMTITAALGEYRYRSVRPGYTTNNITMIAPHPYNLLINKGTPTMKLKNRQVQLHPIFSDRIFPVSLFRSVTFIYLLRSFIAWVGIVGADNAEFWKIVGSPIRAIMSLSSTTDRDKVGGRFQRRQKPNSYRNDFWAVAGMRTKRHFMNSAGQGIEILGRSRPSQSVLILPSSG
jgi:hypothetical protein